jgi:hypothetical protein
MSWIHISCFGIVRLSIAVLVLTTTVLEHNYSVCAAVVAVVARTDSFEAVKRACPLVHVINSPSVAQ